jgi:hypothetical protein
MREDHSLTQLSWQIWSPNHAIKINPDQDHAMKICFFYNVSIFGKFCIYMQGCISCDLFLIRQRSSLTNKQIVPNDSFFTSSPTDYHSVPAPQDRLIRRRVNQDTNILKLAPRIYLYIKEPILSRIALVVTHNLIGTKIYHQRKKDKRDTKLMNRSSRD